MEDQRIAELQARVAVATEAHRKAEERATAGQLALEMVHEIRNPLEALGHLAYLASEDAGHPDKVREYMKLAEEQMTHLRHLANQILGFAKASSSTVPMDLVAVAEGALRIHRRALQSKKVRLVKDLPEELVAPVYRGEMLQALTNLLGNAIDSLPDEGTIYLRMRKHKDEVHLVVADTGHGIHADHLARIFEPFFTTKGERGTGLGLALTKKIVDHHQGTIRVRSSVSPSRSGTTCKVRIPA